MDYVLSLAMSPCCVECEVNVAFMSRHVVTPTFVACSIHVDELETGCAGVVGELVTFETASCTKTSSCPYEHVSACRMRVRVEKTNLLLSVMIGLPYMNHPLVSNVLEKLTRMSEMLSSCPQTGARLRCFSRMRLMTLGASCHSKTQKVHLRA